MVRFVFGPEDVARVRFAFSPNWELVASVRVLARPSAHALPLPWLKEARQGLRDFDGMPMLLALIPPEGYVPDFLGQPPATPPPARRPATATRTPAQGPAHPYRRPRRLLGADARPPLAAPAVAVAGRGAPPRAPVHRRRLRAAVPRPARRRALGRRAPLRRHPLRRRDRARGARPRHAALGVLLAARGGGDGPGVAALADLSAARCCDAVGPRRATRARWTRGADRRDARRHPRRARDAAVDDGTCAPPP